MNGRNVAKIDLVEVTSTKRDLSKGTQIEGVQASLPRPYVIIRPLTHIIRHQ